MEYCVRAVRNFFGRFLQQQNEEDKASRFETYLSLMYKVVIWENPMMSGFALFLTHILFWFSVHFQLKLFGILCLLLLTLFAFDACFDSIGTDIDKSVPLRNIRETVNLFKAFLHYFASMRREHPGTFCIYMCTGFLCLSIIGRTVSGLLLIYFGLIAILTVPGVIYRLPPEFLDALRHALHVLSTNEGVVEEIELLPAPSEDILEEKDADCDSLKTDHTADSYTNSFISGVSAMPSYLEVENSLDGLDDDDDLELASKQVLVSVTRMRNSSSSSSDSEQQKHIKFASTHFSRDSSSSDEERLYEQGLQFPDVDTTDAAALQKPPQPTHAHTATLAEHLTNLAYASTEALLSHVRTAPKTDASASVATKRSDSDSDFEIINAEEVRGDET